jgi:hypothetical protein
MIQIPKGKEVEKANMKRSGYLLVIVPLLLLITTSSPVVASANTHTAYFGVAIYGRGLVLYNHGYAQIPYFIGSTVGTFGFMGMASVTEIQDTLLGEWYQVVPGTLKACGWVSASWSKEGVKCAIDVRIYPIATQIQGILNPDQDALSFSSGLPSTVLGCTGFFKAGSQKTSIQGKCGLYVVPYSLIGLPTDAYMALWMLQFVIDNTSIVLSWVDKPSTATVLLEDGSVTVVSVPAALIFKHEVVVS